MTADVIRLDQVRAQRASPPSAVPLPKFRRGDLVRIAMGGVLSQPITVQGLELRQVDPMKPPHWRYHVMLCGRSQFIAEDKIQPAGGAS